MGKKSDKQWAEELIQSGGELTGAAAGAAIGFFGGTPVTVIGGAAAGALLSQVLKKVGSDIKQRLIGPREEIRVGAAFTYAITGISEKISSGQTLREDGFFTENSNKRIPAEEILEGILLKARDSYEEKKVKLLGTLYASIAFTPAISPSYANQLINLAGQLTYRQLVALSIAMHQLTGKSILANINFRSNEDAKSSLDMNGVSLLTEIYELYQRGLIHGSDGSAWISLVDVNPGGMRLQGTGSVLASHMRLDTVDPGEFEEFLKAFPPSKAN